MELARRLGVVLTERVSIGAITAGRIVELGRYPHLGWSGKLSEHDRDVVRWAIGAVGAGHLTSRDSTKLSDGERQRIMIARALAQEPLLLLLDEPTAFLDMPSRVELMGLLRRLAREERLAVVVSTHDLELALRTADTVWLVEPGGRFHVGSPEDVVLEGCVSDAFQGETIRFHPEELAFRLIGGGRGCAVVHGDGIHAVLARAVLEREGYQLDAARGSLLTVTIESDAPQWQAAHGGRTGAGDTFAALAEFVRDEPDSSPWRSPLGGSA
jgi:iron complex transport system ATP-binding protein